MMIFAIIGILFMIVIDEKNTKARINSQNVNSGVTCQRWKKYFNDLEKLRNKRY